MGGSVARPMEAWDRQVPLLDELSRRGFLGRVGALGIAAVVASAAPLARELIAAKPAAAQLPVAGDALLQAFADTMIPGRVATRTDLGNEIAPGAIAGVDVLPGAVEADALALYRHPLVGFDALEPAFLADLSARSLQHGGPFIALPLRQAGRGLPRRPLVRQRRADALGGRRRRAVHSLLRGRTRA